MYFVNTDNLLMAMATGMMILVAIPVNADNHPTVADTDYNETVLKFHASQSENASFLTDMECPKLSYLELNAHIRKGDMVNYYQSDDSKDFEIKTKSFYRFNERLMLSGSILYGAAKGKNMSGPCFINPEYTPFDIVEMDESNAGAKRREWYSLGGKVGYSLDSRISLGASLEYAVENYAKFKDLRHQNSMMDLNLSLGGKYKITDNVTFGSAYIYRRNIQRVSFKIYGNTDRQYTSLISFGGFYGRSELFGESGYTSNSLPLFTQTNGGTLQLLWETSEVKWFNELGYYKDKGRFGTGSSTSITYSNHNSTKLEYRSKLIVERPRLFHVMELNVFSKSLENNENSYKESTDANGVSQIVYYGSNKVGDKRWEGADITYSFLSGNGLKRSDWFAGIGAGYYSRLITASQYPFYRKQDINTVHANLFVTKNWFKRKNIYTLSFKGGYSKGWGNMNNDGTYATVSENQKVPVSLDNFLVHEYDYYVASQIKSFVSLGYERGITRNLSLYMNVDFTYLIAMNTSLKGNEHIVYAISAGVKF
ncbi:hypothetical protein H6A66_09920 [Bacteroides caecigallinarum]|uniref:DUF6850 family outer membrane beta-barrel protein n=1 Tax=Bacteroides caecigallinarum TaxID=1411144 RepID=UPI001958A8E2|nr:DUF6850 family outer membrane beta-barrel protein [Bacteroides caecigallinarum]MBM6865482.1 hypothetical protein [Bacteroides caecigallinarum]